MPIHRDTIDTKPFAVGTPVIWSQYTSHRDDHGNLVEGSIERVAVITGYPYGPAYGGMTAAETKASDLATDDLALTRGLLAGEATVPGHTCRALTPAESERYSYFVTNDAAYIASTITEARGTSQYHGAMA